MVLITCLTSSIVVQYAGKKLVVIKNQDMLTSVDLPDRILVPVANPDTIENLLDFAILIKDPQSKEPIYPLSVINDDKNADKQIFIQKKNFQKAIEYASATENTLHLTTRVDLNVANGIARAIKDLAITKTIIGWGGNISTMNIIFGTILSHLLDKTEKMILVLRVHQPYNMFERLIVAAPPLSAYESGFADWLKVVLRIATSLNINMVFYTTNDSVEGIKLHLLKCKVNVEYHIFTEDEEFADLAKITGEHDLLFLINARKQTASYDADFDVLKRKLSKNFETKNFVLVYPEQEHVIEEQNS